MAAKHEVISHMSDDEWLRQELEAIEASKATATSVDREVARSHAEPPRVPDDALRIPYFQANDAVVFARVVFDGPLTPEFMRSVGLQLQQMAALMDGRGGGSGDKKDAAEHRSS